MYFLTILFFIAVYIVVAALFVFIVGKLTKRKIFKWLAVASVILLPIWDVILGTAVYHIGCRYIPKVAVYEMAETNSIYYEGRHDYVNKLKRDNRNESDEELTRIGAISNVFRQGYSFAESKVTKESVSYTKNRKIAPVIYRCIPLPKDESRPAFNRTSCSAVNDIKSRYMVKVQKIKAGIAEIDFKNIYDHTNDKLMAEYKQVVKWPYFPFFNWLHWGEIGGHGVTCPDDFYRYNNFEYVILKPKK
jgi:energy-coupling factor transporter transmembrane protein EcfT